MTPPPDLDDPAQRAAYRRELRGIARPLRLTGLTFLTFGLLLGLASRLWWREMPVAIPVAALVLGAFNMIAAVAMRRLYHARRMRGGI